jgi:RNA polymerase sigma-70 factor, ECF subfamily
MSTIFDNRDAAEDAAQQWRADFAGYLRESQSRLYGYIHSLVRDINDTDDLFQQTTLILWRKFRSFDRERCFFPWACGIARLEVASFLRSRGRQRLYFSDDLNLLLVEAQTAMSNDEVEERRDALARCVEKLRERDRDLLSECYKEADGIHEAAQRRRRSTQSVHNSLRRIRRSLFECIARKMAQEARASK